MTSRSSKRRTRAPTTSADYWRRYKELFPKYFWEDEHRLASVVLAGANGSRLTDVDGKEYIDLTSQWGTNNLGNVHPEVLAATQEALERFGFLIYYISPHRPMIELAETLLQVRPSSNLTRVFLEATGTGAAEGAVKHAVERSERPLTLSFIGQYHGLSIGAGALSTLSAHERRFWEPYFGGAVFAPYPFSLRRPPGVSASDYGGWVLDYIDDAILKHIAAPDRIAAALFEPIALEAGTWIPPKGFPEKLAQKCHDHGWYYIDDEVEAGVGRAGTMWAIESTRVRPDLMAMGKSLSGGLMPIAGVLGTEELMAEREIAAGTTFAGHPAACVAAITALDVLRRDHLAERAEKLGRAALKRMSEWTRFAVVGDVRGRGLALAVEFVHDGSALAPNPEFTRRVFFDCVEHRTIPLYNYEESHIRLQPPLTISEEELDEGLTTLESAIERQSKGRAPVRRRPAARS
jgi:4-aminobutyrate aminotransferase-like enzyme